jgi:aldose 1-epimerase
MNMQYSIGHVEEQGLQLLQLKDEQSGTIVSLLPGFGALIQAWTVKSGEHTINIIDSYNSLDQLKKELASSFRGSKLSPFPCRIPEGKYSFDGVHYEFANKFIDGSVIHGLLYDKPFTVTNEFAARDSASVTMEYVYRKDDDQFPFEYACQVVYTLFPEQVLQVQTTLINHGKSALPIADGWHPYFALGDKVDEWMMYFNASALVEFDHRLVPTGNTTPYELFNQPTKIGSTELDNCFLINVESGHPACELFNPNNKLKISFYPDSGYPYLQIYTPPHRKSIAIENLTSAPDSFNNKMGLTILQPSSPQTLTLQYKVSLL